jgi:hypothetical protein
MKSFKDFCEQAFHPDLVNKLSDPKVQKNLRSTVISPGQRYASGPPAMKPQSSPKPEPKEKKDSFVRRMIRNTLLSPIQ